MTTNAKVGYGNLFQIRTATGPDTWTTISETANISPPSYSGDAVEATHNESPSGLREFIAGLGDEGEVSFDMNLIPGGESLSLLRSKRRAEIKARISFVDGTLWTFDAILTGIDSEGPIDDKMSASVTFKLSGESTITEASAPTNLVLPAISGTVQVGQEVTAWEGVWSNAPRSFAYQWKNEGVAIDGATEKTYTPVAGDSGDGLSITVTATNGAGSASATSASIDVAAA